MNLHGEGCRYLPILWLLPKIKGNFRISDRPSQRRLPRINTANTHHSFFPIFLLGHYEFCDHEVVSGTKDNTVNYEITRLFRDERQSVDLPRSKSYAPVEIGRASCRERV